MDTKKLIRIAMLTALAAVLTLFPQLRTPTGGYVHFGDSIIYLASIFMGPVPGAIVGAVGHSISDLISAPVFVPATFIIKGLMGFLIGLIAYQKLDIKHLVFAGIVALLLVTGGYFIAESIMFGVPAALTVLVSSPVQWLMSVVASAVLIPVVSKIRGKIGL